MILWGHDLLTRAFVRHGGLFVTGTDTGVGKTYVACKLILGLREEGLRIAVMKPAESGGLQDSRALKKASGSQQLLSEICPFSYKHALAPLVAAKLENRPFDKKRVLNLFRKMQKSHDGAMVEGAGGLRAPYAEGVDTAWLIKAMRLPVVVVARPGLGTINHALLTLEVARNQGLNVVAVVLNGLKGSGGLAEKTNPEIIAQLGGVPVLGPLPWQRQKRDLKHSWPQKRL
jgi:dethiobiotin synthetase